MNNTRHAQFAGPGIMLFSAVIFGFFGFLYGIDWNTPGLDGNPVLFRQLLGWTLKISAVLFLACGLLTFVLPLLGNAMYSVFGLIGAIMFVLIAMMDLSDDKHGIMAYGPLILFVFAAFNGYGSWHGIRGVLAAMSPDRTPAAPQSM